MSYETKYHPHLCKGLPLKTRKRDATKKIKWILLVCLLMAGINFHSRVFWKEFLIPGDAEHTISAIETFAENIKSGNSLGVAFHDFCLEIIEDG